MGPVLTLNIEYDPDRERSQLRKDGHKPRICRIFINVCCKYVKMASAALDSDIGRVRQICLSSLHRIFPNLCTWIPCEAGPTLVQGYEIRSDVRLVVD